MDENSGGIFKDTYFHDENCQHKNFERYSEQKNEMCKQMEDLDCQFVEKNLMYRKTECVKEFPSEF